MFPLRHNPLCNFLQTVITSLSHPPAVFLKLFLLQTEISEDQKYSNALSLTLFFVTACNCLYECCVKIQITLFPKSRNMADMY